MIMSRRAIVLAKRFHVMLSNPILQESRVTIMRYLSNQTTIKIKLDIKTRAKMLHSILSTKFPQIWCHIKASNLNNKCFKTYLRLTWYSHHSLHTIPTNGHIINQMATFGILTILNRIGADAISNVIFATKSVILNPNATQNYECYKISNPARGVLTVTSPITPQINAGISLDNLNKPK